MELHMFECSTCGHIKEDLVKTEAVQVPAWINSWLRAPN
jgi:uncharacterized Zn finger protein